MYREQQSQQTEFEEDKRHVKAAAALQRAVMSCYGLGLLEDFAAIARRLSQPEVDALLQIASNLEKHRSAAREL